MKRRTWDRYAPVYKRAMRGDEKAYQYMYKRIPEKIRGKDVLEIAAGPGMLAKSAAPAAKSYIATDYSVGMVLEAEKGEQPENLRYEVADAADLPFNGDSFDVVIIANALHVMDDPDRALQEIRRVLRKDGLLIAPNFVSHGLGNALWTTFLKLAGIRFGHRWTGISYPAYLMSRGWNVTFSEMISARIPVLYTECVPADNFAPLPRS